MKMFGGVIFGLIFKYLYNYSFFAALFYLQLKFSIAGIEHIITAFLFTD